MGLTKDLQHCYAWALEGMIYGQVQRYQAQNGQEHLQSVQCPEANPKNIHIESKLKVSDQNCTHYFELSIQRIAKYESSNCNLFYWTQVYLESDLWASVISHDVLLT